MTVSYDLTSSTILSCRILMSTSGLLPSLLLYLLLRLPSLLLVVRGGRPTLDRRQPCTNGENTGQRATHRIQEGRGYFTACIARRWDVCYWTLGYLFFFVWVSLTVRLCAIGVLDGNVWTRRNELYDAAPSAM